MNVRNVHERVLSVEAGAAGRLIDTLASDQDALWPQRMWPPMRFDRPLSVGARGGHGPIRYQVEHYRPGHAVRFRFEAPRGFEGHHRLEIETLEDSRCVLRHVLEMRIRGPAVLSWPLIFRPLHDALVEDALAQAQASLGLEPDVVPWSRWVRTLRWLFSRGRAGVQSPPLALPDGAVHG
jgi:hypothetical protein